MGAITDVASFYGEGRIRISLARKRYIVRYSSGVWVLALFVSMQPWADRRHFS